MQLRGSGDIRIIGPRASGKTTFMAALVHWPNGDPERSPIQDIIAANDEDTQKLKDMARDILENSQTLPPTRLGELPLYNFTIELKPNFLLNPIAAATGRNVRMSVSATDYAGELFTLLREEPRNPDLQLYLDECQYASGILILIDGTSITDRDYADSLAKLEYELNLRFTNNNIDKKRYRIALVFSKAEQRTVWNRYYDQNSKEFRTQDFIKDRFPKTKQILQRWQRNWGCSVACFFCSAFGIMGNPPEPNCSSRIAGRDGTSAVIARHEYWHPFGLVAPIYWLYTGQGNIQLRKI